MATVTDLVRWHYDNQVPVNIGGQNVVLRDRDDIHEWLAQHGIDSTSQADMSINVPEPSAESARRSAGIPPRADPQIMATSGPPEAAHMARQRLQPAPTLFNLPLGARTMSELSDVSAQAIGQRATDIGAAITEPVAQAVEGMSAEASQILESQRPALEEAYSRRNIRRAPSPAHAHRPMYRGQPVRRAAPEPTDRERWARQQYLADLIASTPEFLPSGQPDPFRALAVEELEKTSPTLGRARRGLEALAINALTGTSSLPGVAGVKGAAADVMSAGEEAAGFVASEAGNVLGLGLGVGGRAVELAGEGLKRLPSAIQDVSRALSYGDVPPSPMKGLPYMGLEGQTKSPETLKREAGLVELARAPGLAGMPESAKTEHVLSGLTGAYEHMEELVQGRMDRDTIDNMRTDLSDLMSVVPMLATMVFGIPEEELNERDITKRFTMAVKRSVDSGITLTDSALAGLAYIVANPFDSLHTMPVSTLLTFADVAVALRGTNRAAMQNPKVQQALLKAEVVLDKWVPKIGDVVARGAGHVPLVGKGAEGAIIGATRGDLLAKASTYWKQAFGDATYNTNPAAHLFGDDLVRRPNREGDAARASLEAIGRSMEETDDLGRPMSGAARKKGTYQTEFEEFDKSILPDGTIEQPAKLEGKALELGPKEAKARLAGERPIGTKGGARIRGRKRGDRRVQKRTLWGEAKIVRDELVNHLQGRGGTGKSPYKAADIDKAIAEAMSFVIPNTIMMSKTARTRAVADVRRWASDESIHGQGALRGDTLKKFVEQAEKEILGMAARKDVPGITGSTRVYNLRLNLRGKTFSVVDDSLLKVAGDPTLIKLRREIFNEALTAISNRAAQTVEQGRRQLVIVDALELHARREHRAHQPRIEDQRTGKTRKGEWAFDDVPDIDDEVARVEKSLLKDGVIPAALRRDGGDIAKALEAKYPGKDVIFADEHGLGGVSARRIYRELEDYRPIKSMKNGEEVLRELGVNQAARAVGGERKVALRPIKVAGGIYVNPGTRNTLKWWAKDMAARRADSFWMNLTRQMKSNITSRNPTTHLHNIVSNAVIQTIRRGDVLTPLKVMKVGHEYKQFRQGKLRDPAKREMYRAIERTGGLKTDVVASELKLMERATEITKDGILPHHTLERIYGWEDNVFKLEEAVRNYKVITKELDGIPNGQWVELDLAKGKKVRLTRKDGAWVATRAGRLGKVGKKQKSHKIKESQLRDLVAKASMKPALDLFFDYSDVSMIAKMLRSDSHGAALAAPFYSWYSKALTMPFAQKGIMGDMLSSRPIMRTSDPKLVTAQMKDIVMASARRSLVANSMRQEFLKNQDMMAQALGGGGHRRVPSIMLPVLNSSNPLYFEFKNLEYMSPSQPADALLRLIYHGIGTFHLPSVADAVMRGDVDPHKGRISVGRVKDDWMSPEPFPARDDDLKELARINPVSAGRLRLIRNIWRRNIGITAGVSWKDATELMGLTGGVLAELVESFGDVDTAAQRERVYDSFISLLIPGLYARAFDVSAGYAWRYALKDTVLPPELEKEAREIAGTYATTITGGGRLAAEIAPASAQHRPYDNHDKQFMRWAVRRLVGIGTQPKMVLDEIRIDMKTGREKKSPGALSKQYARHERALRDSVGAPIKARATSLWADWTDGGDKEDFKGFYVQVKKLEDTLGTRAAKAFFEETTKQSFPMLDDPATGKKLYRDGLIAVEIEKALEHQMEAVRAAEKAVRAAKGQKPSELLLAPEED